MVIKLAKHIDADAEAEKYLNLQLGLAKTEKTPDILTAALILAVIAVLAVSFWIIPDRDFSDEENRTLAPFPAFSAEALLSGEFTGDFADYMADQFPLRDQFVGLKAVSETVLLKGENNGIMSKGGVLAERFDSTDTENTEKNLTAISAFRKGCAGYGIDADFAVLGRTMDVYSFPLYGSEATERALEKLEGTEHIDLLKPFENRSGEYVYYRTDHHYTTLGAYYAYEYLAPYLGYEANPLSHYDRVTVTDSFFGTTYSKSGMKWTKPDSIELFRWDGDGDFTVTVADTGETHDGFYFEEYLEKKDKYSVFLGGNYGRVDITANGGEREKLLIVKDSFAHALVPFLAEHYDITMIDTRYYKRPVIRLAQEEGFARVLVICNIDTLSSATPFDILRMGIK